MRSPTIDSQHLKPISTSHPAIALGSIALIGAMLYWSFSTNFRQPDLWVSAAVSLLVVMFNVASRHSRSHQ